MSFAPTEAGERVHDEATKAWAARAVAKVLWQPQPGPQTALLECPVFEVFYGGARGGGKTDGSLGDWIQHEKLYGEHAAGKFFRRTLKQLSQVIKRSRTLFRPLGAKYNENKAEWTFPSGATLGFAYLERDEDAENYQGHSYTRVYIEEATNFPNASPINKLRATLRSAVGVPVGMRLTGNPGGPGHNWVKARYIDPCPTGWQIVTEEEILEIDGVPTKVSLSRVFIPSKLRDNELLFRSDPTYVLRLRQSGSEALVKAWLNGDWNIVDGAYFSEWDYSKHVLDTQSWLPRIPRSATRFRAFDWGSAKPFSCGWYAISDGEWGLPKGALVKYREWYGAADANVGLKMTAEAVALGIKNRELGERITRGWADPSIFIRDGGPSIAESMALAGISWWRADNKRKAGWEQMRGRLQGHPLNNQGLSLTERPQFGPPLLYFLDCCEDSIRTIPSLQHDEGDPEDLDTDGEDHAADETRYAVMSRPFISKAGTAAAEGKAPPPPGKFTIAGLIALNRKRRDSKQHI